MQVRIERDHDPMDPRKEWDNPGTMVCFHQRYNLGDTHDYRASDYSGWSGLEKQIRKDHDIAVLLPIYMYDHSGYTISTTPFSCPWDSGQIGFIFITKDKVREEFSKKRISRKLLDRVTTYLENEVKVYDQYLRGDVYGYVIEDDNGECLESCWGFFGEEFCQEEANEVMKNLSE